MAIPAQGFIRIYPDTVSIISGAYSVAGTGIGAASALASVAALQIYYNTRVDTPANAPRMRFIDEVPALGGTFVPSAGVYELSFSANTTRILFDPSGVAEEIDFLSADFPMGLLIDQLRVHWNGRYITGPSRDRLLTNLSLKYFGSTVKSVTPTPGATFDGDVESDTFAIIPSIAKWSPIQVFKTMGWSATMTAPVDVNLSQPQLRNDLFYIEGVYNTAFFNLTLDTPNALPGEIVQITDGNSGLNAFDDIKIYWDTLEGEEDVNPEIPGFTGGVSIPDGLIYTHTANIIKFQLPTNRINGYKIPYGGRRLMVTGIGDGTTFVGEFPIANLNVLLVDGSGVYQLERGKRNDTYYDRDTSPIETIDIKIPSPGGRTGFF